MVRKVGWRKAEEDIYSVCEKLDESNGSDSFFNN